MVKCFHHRFFWQARFLVGLVALLCAMSFAAKAGLESDPRMGQVVIDKNADGRLEVFRVSGEGQLQHRWQKEPGGEWSPWWGLGGSVFPGLAVGKRAEGQLEVFAVDRTSHSLASIRQIVPNGPGWTGWTNFGGQLSAPVAVGQNRDGRLEVFGVELGSGAVCHLWQTNIQEGWSAWGDLGGAVQPGLSVGRNKNGQLELFGVDARNHSLLHCHQTTPNDSMWSLWSSLGGTIWPGLGLGQNTNGLLEVFAVNRTNGEVNHIVQMEPANGVRWSGWNSLGGNVEPGIAVGENADGRLEVFALPHNQTALYHCWQQPGEAEWSLFYPIARDLDVAGSAQPYPAVTRNQDGTLLLVARDSANGNRLNYKRQISAANTDWLDWFSLDHPAFPYTAHTWQEGDGLPHTLVQAIAQTSDGYLWVGTRGGLARFDGVHFTSFDAKNTPELKSSSITALCTDKEGALWIGTEAGGVVRLNEGVFDHFGRTNGLTGDNVTVIYEDRDGAMWFGTQTGASYYKDKKFTSFTRDRGLLSNVIRSIYRDRRNDLWIGTPAGLNLWRSNAMVAFTADGLPDGLPDNSIRGIIQDKGGRLWVGSDKGMIWHNVAGGFYAYDRRYGLSDSIVTAICEDREGNLWVGTYSGLNRFRDGRFFNENNNEGARYDKVNAIFEDRDGNLWVGSIEGLIRLTPKRFFPFNDRQGLTYNNTVSVLEDRAGSLWVGTSGGGLNRIKEDGVAAYTANTNGLLNNLVLSLCEGHDGSLWVGSDREGGLSRLQNGTFTYYTATNGLADAPISVLHEDRGGKLWVGTAQGLSSLKDGTFTSYTKKQNLAAHDIRAICEDHAGRLWFGTERGLSRWEEGHFTNFTFTAREGGSDNMVTALYEDQEQSLWIGTASKGLKRLKAGRFFSYTTQQGLFSDEILEILEDDRGWLWMSSSKGVFRVLKRDLDALDAEKKKIIASVSYGIADGMESTLCSGLAKPAACKTRDGKLWFPTTKGLVFVDPQNVRINYLPPPVYIEQMIADKKPLMHGAANGRPDELLIEVSPGRGDLEFHFTVLAFQKPEKNRLKYMLEGVDLEWVDADPRRVAHYMNVEPGSYRFRVIGCNSDGVWNETGASLKIVLLPHFWQTWWFHGLVGLAIVAGLSGTVRYITRRRMQRKLDLLERQRAIEHERARIAKDIHDDLGSSLTRIMMLGDRMEESLDGNPEAGGHARKIVASARATVQSLDEIVWAVNPENDTLDSLIGYIGQFADQFFENTSVRCRRELPLDSFPMVLNAEIRHDLFLVLKEALNNVLKHAHASEVRLQIAVDTSSLTVVIEDNGCGFDPLALMAGRTGNGLRNMQKRVENLGGQMSLVSRPGAGTRLTLTAQFQPKS